MGGDGGWGEQLYTSGRDVAADTKCKRLTVSFQSEILPSFTHISGLIAEDLLSVFLVEK